eukprot:CAMPEP_0182876128 /NCGR_PEP_ID=MMETSP0034_2-20130328/13964_1 /TAXON_ID=156128 /ORGANISM="Nephroselmis pyriformis, Strain CCMP717" /LENGTH=285 /DNA_ID=CAMNT_0025008899 /DNA_START=21 /DNA_END=878 /DNA_ORIENTATION=+
MRGTKPGSKHRDAARQSSRRGYPAAPGTITSVLQKRKAAAPPRGKDEAKKAAHQPPPVRLTLESLKEAQSHLTRACPRLAAVMKDHGVPERLLASSDGAQGSHFQSLTKSIVFQQLATAAAATIHGRLVSLLGGQHLVTPQAVLQQEIPALRSCGLSERKASYIVDLAEHFSDGRLSDDAIRLMSDEELKLKLTAVRGIGPWSVDMFAMFALGRPDILPIGDLAVRKGFKLLYGLCDLPSPARMEELAAPWRPYRSVGSFFMWKVVDTGLKGEGKGKGNILKGRS